MTDDHANSGLGTNKKIIKVEFVSAVPYNPDQVNYGRKDNIRELRTPITVTSLQN